MNCKSYKYFIFQQKLQNFAFILKLKPRENDENEITDSQCKNSDLISVLISKFNNNFGILKEDVFAKVLVDFFSLIAI